MFQPWAFEFILYLPSVIKILVPGRCLLLKVSRALSNSCRCLYLLHPFKRSEMARNALTCTQQQHRTQSVSFLTLCLSSPGQHSSGFPNHSRAVSPWVQLVPQMVTTARV